MLSVENLSGFCLCSWLYLFFTHNSVAKFRRDCINRYADYATVIGLITYTDKKNTEE